MSNQETNGSEQSSESGESQHGPGEVTDEQLPEDLRPSEENPLARHPDQTGDEADVIGQDREDGPETAPLDREQADYGSGGAV